MSEGDCQSCANLTIQTLEKIHNDAFDCFGKVSMQKSNVWKMNLLFCHEREKHRLGSFFGKISAESPVEAKVHYRQIDFEYSEQ